LFRDSPGHYQRLFRFFSARVRATSVSISQAVKQVTPLAKRKYHPDFEIVVVVPIDVGLSRLTLFMPTSYRASSILLLNKDAMTLRPLLEVQNGLSSDNNLSALSVDRVSYPKAIPQNYTRNNVSLNLSKA
jgi:hypothetical protein